jgi:hypothetical protein
MVHSGTKARARKIGTQGEAGQGRKGGSSAHVGAMP